MGDEAARKAMHVLLDMVASQDFDAPDEANLIAAQTAFQSLDHDAIVVTVDDETDTINVDPTALLTAAGTIILTLVDQVARSRDKDPLTILNVLRQHMDGVLSRVEPE